MKGSDVHLIWKSTLLAFGNKRLQGQAHFEHETKRNVNVLDAEFRFGISRVLVPGRLNWDSITALHSWILHGNQSSSGMPLEG